MPCSLPLTDAAFFRDATTPGCHMVALWDLQLRSTSPGDRQPNDLNPTQLMRVTSVNTFHGPEEQIQKISDLGRTEYCPLDPRSEQQLVKNVKSTVRVETLVYPKCTNCIIINKKNPKQIKTHI